MGLIDHKLSRRLTANLATDNEPTALGSRFYFHLTNGLLAMPDRDGVQAESPLQAVEQARRAMRELRSSGDLPEAADGWQIEVTDSLGFHVDTIPVC